MLLNGQAGTWPASCCHIDRWYCGEGGSQMLRFPLDGLLDEQACYEFLLRILHPDGLHFRAAIHSRRLKLPPTTATDHSRLPLSAVRCGLQPVHLHDLVEDLLSLFHHRPNPARYRSRYSYSAFGRRTSNQPHPSSGTAARDTDTGGLALFPLPHPCPTQWPKRMSCI